jgi:hypothetical protein
MRYILILSLVGLWAGSVLAAPERTDGPGAVTGHPFGSWAKARGDGAALVRTAGDTIEDATVIPALPYVDSGSTCGFNHDYVPPFCVEGYPHTAPDVVYSYTPAEDGGMTVSLCGSQYDTALWVYRGGVEHLVGCNDNTDDEACRLQSKIVGVAVNAGETYYIVVSGAGSACGSYILNVTPFQMCDLACPPGAMPEGEPPCGDYYVDEFNGGCGSPNLAWEPIEAGPDGCATVCGKTCTFFDAGGRWHDSDWYVATAAGGHVTVSCESECPVIVMLPWTDCGDPFGAYVEIPPCTPAEFYSNCSPGAVVWVRVWQPYSDLEIPESDYLFTVCGLTPGATPVRQTTWGTIKARYHDEGR